MPSDFPSSYQKSALPLSSTDQATATTTSRYNNYNMAIDSHHMKTYTAGEDKSRLAEMAKQFGLEHQRQPRKQIRRPRRKNNNSEALSLYSRAGQKMKRTIQDHSLEVARMRAAYSRERHFVAATAATVITTASDSDWHLDDVGLVIVDSSTAQSGSANNVIRQSSQWMSDMPDWMEAIELEEEDLHAVGVGGDLTSAVLGIIKGMVGPAILYLPHGLAKSGFALAIPIMLLATFLFLFSCQCLLDSWRLEHTRLLQQVQEKEEKVKAGMQQQQQPNNGGVYYNMSKRQDAIEEGNEENDGDDVESKSLLGRISSKNSLLSTKSSNKSLVEMDHHKRTFFLSYPELAYRALGYHFEQLVKLGITLMQSCVCLTYLIFVPQNLSTVVKLFCSVTIAPEWFLIVMVAVQVPLSWIRDIRKLTATNLLANLLILYGLIVCIVLALMQATSDIPDNEPMSPIQILADKFQNLQPFGKNWFMFIGTSVFMFEGSITVLVPLQEAVYTEEDREKFPAVNRNTTLCIIAFYIFFSITCWMALGNDVRIVLTTSLPPGAASTSVQLAYSVAVIFTFPLQNYPALEIACRSLASAMDKYNCCDDGCNGSKNDTLKHNLTSTALVIILAMVAVTTMDSLDKVVSFLGGLLGCPIAFIFPPLIHLQLAGNAGTLSRRRKIMDIVVACTGFVAMILSTMTTLLTN